MNNSTQTTLEKYCTDLNIGHKDLALLATLRMYYHTFRIWNAYKNIKDVDATRLYAQFWKKDVQKSFAATLKSLNITEVPNIKVLGKMVAHVTACAPSLYETAISEENLHVGYVTWCGNTGILKIPNRTRFCADDYIRAECNIELDYLNAFIEEAKKIGLKDDVEIIIKNPRCANCMSSACQFILKVKDAPYQDPEKKFDFIDYALGYENPLNIVLSKLRISTAEQSMLSISSFFAKDLSAWEVLFEHCADRTEHYYKLIWDEYAELNVNELKLRHSLGESCTKDSLLDELLLFGLRNMLIPCSIINNKTGLKKYSVDLSQFARTSQTYPYQEKYLADVFAMLENYVLNLIKKSGLEKITVEFTKEKSNNKLIIEVRF